MHESVLEEATINHAALSNQFIVDGMEAEGEAGERLGREIGVRIQATRNSPVIVGDGSAAPAADFINCVPSSRKGSPSGRPPGCRSSSCSQAKAPSPAST